MRLKNLILVLAALFIMAGVFGCGKKQEEPAAEAKPAAPVPKKAVERAEPAYGDTIVTGSIGDASNLIPALASDGASFGIIGLVYNGLLKTDKNQEIVTDLAESWKISEDGLTISFVLRKGVKWHDGQPFTSRDVMFTYKVMIDPKTPTAYGEDYKQVKKAEAPDDYTFKVTYERPYAPALISWSFSIMPAHLLEGKDITQSPLSQKPIGTGPYIFKEWLTGQKIVLKANPDYFEGPPYISRYIFRIIPDTATMFLELKSGGLDWMSLTPTQYKRQTNTEEFMTQFRKYEYLASSYTYLGFNLVDPKFKDKKVRQAIAHAIDSAEIIEGVLLGLGQPANGPYKPGTWVHNPNVRPYRFDPELAKRLLNEAGWIDTDSDGILDKEGQPFSFTIITNQGNKMRETTALIMQQRLKTVGIEVKVRIIEWAAFIKNFIDKKNFEAIILGWSIPVNPDLFDVWHSSKTNPGELNFVSFKNEEVDRLIDEARFTFDREKMKTAYGRIQEILQDEVPYVFLYVAKALPAVASRFHGIKPAPAGIAYNFTKWYVPKNQQKYKITP